ncbi:hypothetical protein K9M74_02210 [Candidatus Woesearchaeota archaeon]|nr:hypothetical protein [Candidatus Woesearchaeota archaeon]
MQLKETTLKEKGWNDEEIERAREILIRAEEKKHPRKLAIEKMLFWFMLGIIVVGTILGAWIIEPLLLVTTQTQAIISVVIFGLLFGSLATILFRDIEQLQTHHHIVLSLIIPLTAILTSIIITKQAKIIATALALKTNHNPYILGIAYAVTSLIPYIIFMSIQRKEQRATQNMA